jgi:RNA polymerase sigma factor (sigma-70 family)
MAKMQSIVFVIDDDASVRDGVKRLIRSVGLQVEVFASPQEFLRWTRPTVPSCLVLDVRLHGTSGLDLQRYLIAESIRMPIIFITAHGDVPMSVRAMKAGAIDFLTKPFRDQDLLDSIHVALERDSSRLDQESQLSALRKCLDSLTPREYEVVLMVVSGMPNKLIAAEIGISENTVKVHRSRAMEKMQARSLADLIKIIERLGLSLANAS